MTACPTPRPAPSTSVSTTPLTTVVLDLGNVLLRWDPRLAWTREPDDAVEAFLASGCFAAWNHRMDAGEGAEQALAALAADAPQHLPLARSYLDRFDDAVPGPVPGSTEVVDELAAAGVRLLGLTNWPAHTFPRARARFDLLDRLEDVLVSGVEGVAKPDPAVFALLLSRFELDPAATVFVDDLQRNVDAAVVAGLVGVRFTDAASLRGDLRALGLPLAG
jgi:2-haloacid dehalogenase